jgi:hypothetical protein
MGNKLLFMLLRFYRSLPKPLQSTAVAVLVGGNAVELTVQIMASAGKDSLGHGVPMLVLFLANDQGRERMCTRSIAGQVIMCAANWLLEVRGLTLCWGKLQGVSPELS